MTLTKIIRYFYFQPLFNKKPFKAVQYGQIKIDPCLIAAFGKFLENLGFLVVREMHLHLRRLPQRILPPVNIPNDKQTNKIHSAKFKETQILTSLLNITTLLVTYEKYVTRFRDVVVVLILRVCTWVFQFPLKRSCPYNDHGYSLYYCNYYFDFFTRAHFCIALLCAKCFSIKK